MKNKEVTGNKTVSDHPGKSGGLLKRYISIAVLPVIILTFMTSLIVTKILTNVMYRQVRVNMQNVENLLEDFMNSLYPGDYTLKHMKDSKGKDVYSLFKGDTEIGGENCKLPDQIRTSMGLDISIIYYDTRMYSTLKDSKGNSAVGTAINPRVLNSIYEKKTAQFYENADVNGLSYFVYYQPIKNSKGACIDSLMRV